MDTYHVDAPTFTITHGNPTDEEAAALVAVLVGLAAAQERRKVAPELSYAGGWKSYWRVVRSPLHANQEAWRGSLRH